jgi:uridine phosphorylase
LRDRAGDEEGIIRPGRGGGDPVIGPDAIMVMVPTEVHFLALKTGAERIPLSGAGLPCVYRPKGAWENLSLSGPFLGAPQAVLAMEKLVALGAGRFWVLGWCGSLQDSLRVGDAVIPTGAVSEEGTSSHYPIGELEAQPDRLLTKRLMDALIEKGLPFRSGRIWTTDAPYRETPQKVLHYQREGVLAVEMEMSALMTVGLFRSVAVTSLLVVSDELFDLTWHRGFSDPKLKKATRSGAETLLQLAQSTVRP